MALQIRRGTEAERLTITPLQGELLYTTDSKQLFLGDGTTIGGVSISEQAQDAIASLVSGSHTGIYFTYDDTANTLTATVTGGVDSLNTLTDVAISGVANDDILKYGGPGVGWINGTIGIDVLNDVTITAPVTDNILKYDGASWVNGSIGIDSLADVAVSTVASNDVIFYNGSTWANGSIPLDALADVQIISPSIGQVIKFDGTSWINSNDEIGSLGSTLDSLSDVILITPTVGQALTFDGTDWVNTTISLSLSDLSNVYSPTPTVGQILKYTGTVWASVDDTSLQAVSGDTAPALGGNLDIGAFSITGTGNINTTGDIGAGLVNAPVKGNIKSFDNSVVLDAGSKIATLNAVYSNTVDVGSTTTNGQLNVFTTDSEYAVFSGLTAGGLNASWLKFETSRTSLSTPAVVQSNDFLSGLLLHGYNGTLQKLTVAFGGQVDGAINAGNVPGAFVVLTKSDTGTDNYMKFDSTGKLNAPIVAASKAIQQPVYADAIARDAAITTPAAGMMVFMSDTSKFQGYTGSAWVDLH